MLMVRPVTAGDPALRSIDGRVLCGEEVAVLISRSGFSLEYRPVANAVWRVFGIEEEAIRRVNLGMDDTALFGAFRDEEMVGQAVVCRRPTRWAEILDLRVDAVCRREGVGTMLLSACERFARQHGMAGLSCTVGDDNPVMCQFLGKSGFKVQGLDRMRLAMGEEVRMRPLLQRPCALMMYRPLEGGMRG